MEETLTVPEIKVDDCDGCGDCVPVCPLDALKVVDDKVTVTRTEDCEYCGDCEEVCPSGAISCPFEIVLEDNS